MTDPDDADWLRALVWPAHTERMADRPLHWLTGPTGLDGGESVGLDWVRREDGAVRRDRLVDHDPHGAWLSWRDS